MTEATRWEILVGTPGPSQKKVGEIPERFLKVTPRRIPQRTLGKISEGNP